MNEEPESDQDDGKLNVIKYQQNIYSITTGNIRSSEVYVRIVYLETLLYEYA